MRTFAQKQNRPQKPVSSSLARPNKALLGPTHREYPFLHLQRTIGNQAVLRMLQTNAEQFEVGLTHTASPRLAPDFSQIPLHSKSPIKIQAKLTENALGDIYQQESNRVSKQEMNMSTPQLQRTCACGGECPKCQTKQPGHEHERTQTKRVGSSDLGETAVSPIVHEVQRSSGQPLDAVTRGFMEPRFGHDFSQVRVHSNEVSHSAIQLAAKLDDAPDKEDVGRITLQADVDAGVPPAKAPAKPPAKAPAAPNCKYKITYANVSNPGCEELGPEACRGANVSKPECEKLETSRGARIRYDITKVQAMGKGCPATLDGLKLTEKVTSDAGCRPGKVETGAGCTIYADKAKPLEGQFRVCTDTYSVCGGVQSFLFAGCTQILTQEIFIGGVLAETHEIKFEIYRRGNQPSGKVTRT